MGMPRIEHLSAGPVDWHDDAPAAANITPLTLCTGWRRCDGETDERTCVYTHDGSLAPSEALELADLMVRCPGFHLRVNAVHRHLGVTVLRSWAELFGDAPLTDTLVNFQFDGPEGARFAMKCAPEAFALFHRVCQRLLGPIAERTLASAVAALTEDA